MNMKFGMENKQKSESVGFSSRADLSVGKFNQYIQKKKIDPETLNSEDLIKQFISKNHILLPGVTPEEVITKLKESGFIKEPIPEKKIEAEKEVIFHKTEFKKLSGIKKIEDEEIQKRLEENKFFLELEKNVFKNEKELDLVLNQALSLEKENSIETEEYYNEFADAGLIKGGRAEVRADLEGLKERKELFKKKIELLDQKDAKNKEINKKVATIVERAVAYGVSNLNWYGENVSIEPVSEFDDVKRGVDDMLEIRKEEAESSFMGLGIDVTYRGLLSEQYKEKFFKLLQSIRDGYKTKIKYFKNHKGEMMKEFSVPKIVLYFNVDDVKNLVSMIKNSSDSKILEKFKNSSQKFAVMNQIIIQCELLSSFAEESKNDIFKKYTEIVLSIKELSWKNPEIKEILDKRHEDEVSSHIRFLIQEFKDIEKQKIS